MKKIYTVLLMFIALGSFAQRNFFSEPVDVKPIGGSRATADTLFWDQNNTSIPQLYRCPDPITRVTAAGYVCGTDQMLSAFGDEGNYTEENAQIFDNAQPLKVIGAKFCFGAKSWYSNDTNSKITFKLYALDSTYINVYAEIKPGPGTLLSQVTMKLSDVKILKPGVETLFTGSQNVIFPTPIDIDSGGYVIGYDIKGLNPIDTLGLLSSAIGKNHPKDKSLVKFLDSPWKTFKDSLAGWGADIDLAIFPIVEQTRYNNIVADVCYGGSYVFKNQTLTQSGIYADSLVTDDGHDSIITLNLTILDRIDTAVQLSHNTLTAQTISGATYKWVDCFTLDPIPGQTGSSFSPAKSGTYWVEITKQGCVSHSSCIDVDIACKAFFTVTPGLVDGEYEVHEASAGAGLQYTWDFGDDSTSNEHYPQHIYTDESQYTICLTISGDSSCSDVFCSDSFYVIGGLMKKLTVKNPVGISDLAAINFSLLPNPAKGVCTIYAGNDASASWNAGVYNIQGQLVKEITAVPATQRYTLNVNGFSPGLYLVRVNTADGRSGIQKLVVE